MVPLPAPLEPNWYPEKLLSGVVLGPGSQAWAS